jgi:hypothetical protein
MDRDDGAIREGGEKEPHKDVKHHCLHSHPYL